jgi:fatty acid kinase fatty acid binding subunit
VIAVVTDSAANVPAELARELGIAVVPLQLRFGDETYRDGVDMDGPRFYERLRGGEFATTAAPSVGDWLDAFERSGANEVVCVTLAGGLSATHHEAKLAAERFGGRIEVVDSGSASMGEGFVAVEAARAAGDGLDRAVERAREVAARVRLLGAIETFEYLRRSGRVTKLQAYAATALSIRPVFRLVDGEIQPVGRPRTRSRALAMLADEAVRSADGSKLHVAALHASAPDDAAALLERVRARVDVVEEFLVESTPAIGANAGPGLVGLAFHAE